MGSRQPAAPEYIEGMPAHNTLAAPGIARIETLEIPQMKTLTGWRCVVGLAALTLGAPSAVAQDARLASSPLASAPKVVADSPLAAGRYLVIIGGCNDCHTPGYDENYGKVPEQDWLTGTAIGWRGPWGTTYPSNLRLLVHDMSEDAWVTMLRTRQSLPPMPWMNLNQLGDADARALYKYIASLGPRGERMPAVVPPNKQPVTPYLSMEPVAPRPMAAHRDPDE